MHGVTVYLEPKDILERLSEEDKERFNQCVFYDTRKMVDGSIEIDCILFNDPDVHTKPTYRYRYCGDVGRIKLL